MPGTTAARELWALLGVAVAAGAATSLGGLAALRLRADLGLLLGFGAGAVAGVAFFDLLPEALADAAVSPMAVMTAAACGFAGYLLFDRAVLGLRTAGAARGHLRAGLLTTHSLMDGLGVGLAFKISTASGLILAAAVIAHDLLDGANTVSFSLSAGPGGATPRRWLAADALAPAVGIALSRLVSVSGPALALLLAIFAGMFLNVGASELLPQSYARRPRASTTAASLLGLALIYLVVQAAR